MTDATNEPPELRARYFRDPEDGGIQEVYGVADDSVYLNVGYVEVSEADYLAATEAIDTEDMEDA